MIWPHSNFRFEKFQSQYLRGAPPPLPLKAQTAASAEPSRRNALPRLRFVPLN